MEENRNPESHTWSVRVRRVDDLESRAYAGKNAFSVGKQASFSGEEALPTAVEYLLGALGADMLSGFQRQAAKRGIAIQGAEMVVSGRLDNPLVFLGVIGAEGKPSFASITATFYVGADADEPVLEEAWRATIALSPLASTLERCIPLKLSMQLT